MQTHDGQQGTAHQCHLIAILHGRDHVRGGLRHFSNGKDRYDVALSPDADYQAVDDGKRQRNLEEERRTLAGRRFDLDLPAQLLDLFPDTSMPTPRPETSVTCSAVEKPG
jgi:hypothetical protein